MAFCTIIKFVQHGSHICLTLLQRHEQVQACEEFLIHYEEGNDFLSRIITGDE